LEAHVPVRKAAKLSVSSQIKILTVMGTRPEAIRMVHLVLVHAADDRFDAKVCITAQHGEVPDKVLDMFKLSPEYDLDIIKPGQDLTDVTTAIL
jgi:UDP-N-acetylglucosamine 2-epimerase (non-hydrolysing)